jgi:predicted RNA methylase
LNIVTLPLAAANIGEFFTPPQWARWLLEKWQVGDRWLAGATICDPTAGAGIFALSLLAIARERNIPLTTELISRITLIERKITHLNTFREQVVRQYGINFPESNCLECDLITNPPDQKFDILVGNPPWANFANLPDDYKQILKPYFVAAGLVPDRKQVLLGASRMDIAALILKVALGRLLTKQGKGYFFVPLSLFSGGDAHLGFRNYSAQGRSFRVKEVFEFTETPVFEAVVTAYACAAFEVDILQTFPVPYYREHQSKWQEYVAKPLRLPTDEWRIIDQAQVEQKEQAIEIPITPNQKPRQGANTCGANAVFIFEQKPDFLPADFVYPLVTKELWREGNQEPNKWILLPYEPHTGKPIDWERLSIYPELRRYLEKCKTRLINRRGTLIQGAIAKGYWWALLGVGLYSFAPYKIIWQAYGKSDFSPLLLSNVDGQFWQGNQAMHAFIPCWSLENALQLLDLLKNPRIPRLLHELNGGGKCNWAQPGKIKKILQTINRNPPNVVSADRPQPKVMPD